MFVISEDERLYLSHWEYNAARILTALAKTVEDQGGSVKPLKHALVSDRNYDEEPVRVSHTSYISFTFSGFYYYYQTDDNPFFEFYWEKAKITDGKYDRDAALDEDTKEWCNDDFIVKKASDEAVEEAAMKIFNFLTTADPSPILRDKHRERVPNTYNSGYHYETIYAPARIAEVDF